MKSYGKCKYVHTFSPSELDKSLCLVGGYVGSTANMKAAVKKEKSLPASEKNADSSIFQLVARSL